MIEEKIDKNKFNVIFAFEISGIAENRIWDPVGSDTSILISRLFYIKIHFFMSYENESSDLKYDLRNNRKMYNLICLYVRAFATSALTFTSVKHDAIHSLRFPLKTRKKIIKWLLIIACCSALGI